jgi:hypothetical protein
MIIARASAVSAFLLSVQSSYVSNSDQQFRAFASEEFTTLLSQITGTGSTTTGVITTGSMNVQTGNLSGQVVSGEWIGGTGKVLESTEMTGSMTGFVTTG